jgi:hypothetical protein
MINKFHFLTENLILQFPYCDGSHGAMNKELCENVGPIVVKHKD